MKISNVCKQTGLTKRAVRFYTEKGLLRPASVERGDRDFYDYSDEDVRLLKAISTLRKLDISIDDIRKIILQPYSIPDIVSHYREQSRAKYEETNRIMNILLGIDVSVCTDIYGLAHYVENADQTSALPPRDIEPDFSALDDMTDKEMQEALMRSHDELVISQYRRIKTKIIKKLSLIALLVIVLVSVVVAIHIWRDTRPVEFEYSGKGYIYSTDFGSVEEFKNDTVEAEITLSGTLYTNWDKYEHIDMYDPNDRYAVGALTIKVGGEEYRYEFYRRNKGSDHSYNNEADYFADDNYEDIWIQFYSPDIDFSVPSDFSYAGKDYFYIHYNVAENEIYISIIDKNHECYELDSPPEVYDRWYGDLFDAEE